MTVIELIQSTDEDLLTSLAKTATTRVLDGENPTDVVVDLAKQSDLNPHMVNRLCESLNVGHTLAMFKDADHRLNEFPLADEKEAFKRLFQEQPIAKAASWYNSRSHVDFEVDRRREALASVGVVKEAEVQKPPVDLHLLSDRAEQALDHVRTTVEYDKTAFIRSIIDLNEFFRRYPERFAEVDSRSPHAFGKSASAIMDLVYRAGSVSPFVKRGEVLEGPVVVQKDEPYHLLKSCIDKAAYLRTIVNQYAELSTKVTSLRSMAKKAGLGSFLMYKGLSGRLNKARQATSIPAPQPLLFDAPELEAEVRGIKAVTALHDVMTNDEVLSEQDPDIVLGAYNDIVSMVPNVASQPLLLRSLLRKSVQQGGILEPFEVDQLVRSMSTVRQMQPSTLKQQYGIESMYSPKYQGTDGSPPEKKKTEKPEEPILTGE